MNAASYASPVAGGKHGGNLVTAEIAEHAEESRRRFHHRDTENSLFVVSSVVKRLSTKTLLPRLQTALRKTKTKTSAPSACSALDAFFRNGAIMWALEV
jgi:hypothetical protein